MMELELIHFSRGTYLRLVKMNKLEQLRKYIFDREIERIQFEQVQKKKLNLLELVKLFQSKVYLWDQPSIYMIL